jgi:hypothetical protein
MISLNFVRKRHNESSYLMKRVKRARGTSNQIVTNSSDRYEIDAQQKLSARILYDNRCVC